MSLIPDEELNCQRGMNLAPMVDFLFLIIAILSTMVLTKAFLFDSNLEMAKVQTSQELAQNTDPRGLLHLALDPSGNCRWLLENAAPKATELTHLSEDVQAFQKLGLFPSSDNVKIFLHIDSHTEWGTAINAILAARETGYSVHPVFEKKL